jgi:hypothetical protein
MEVILPLPGLLGADRAPVSHRGVSPRSARRGR